MPQRLACPDLPPVPPLTPEPTQTGDLVLHAPLGGQDPPPSTSQWVDLGTVPAPTTSDLTLTPVNGDPMDMLKHLRTGSLSPLESGGASVSVAAEGRAISPPPSTPAECCLLYTSPSPRD